MKKSGADLPCSRKVLVEESFTPPNGTWLIVALCPTYQQIGGAAGVILLACRIVQGISTAVEAPLSTAHAVELVPVGREGFAAVLLGGSVVLVLNMTLYNVVTSSLMPKSCRGAGTALGYGIGVALFGGTASYLLVWLQSLNASWIFPVYVAVLSVLSIVFYVLARRKSGIFIGS
ncbi:hypothetical protein [Arthrobacter sp. AZCC_0090]|uniref:hypothetical protein n=1 Tax=Arthrobacter sp. AZCC_0090 TaxID=2735881 RepID=UPI0021AA96BE|nr:hypothetical protein [Arthrobacter sp. AZCC_0090]